MSTDFEPGSTQIIEINGWKIRQRVPVGASRFPVLLLLHGWTGDENVMWVFASRLPHDVILLSPRGLYPAPQGGYGWQPHVTETWPTVDDFRPAVNALRDLLISKNFSMADFSKLRLVGFSQGAALAFSYAFTFPQQIYSIASLSGFLPDGITALAGGLLKDKPVFLAHGTQDELVPVERARQAVELLRSVGVQVHYCEDDVGHRLSAACFHGMQTFFERY
jgi:phospholipase/carboxylesterase